MGKQNVQNKKNTSGRGVSVALAIFAILIVAVLAITVMSESGVFIRNTSAVAGETVEVDSAMMSFFLNEHIMNWYNSYGAYISYGLISLDMSQSLKTQTYGKGSETSFLGAYDGTWYDYFLDSVLEEVNMYVTYAEAAKAAGLTLTEEDEKEIDDILKSIKENLKATGAGYSDWYGKGVKAKDIRNCYELIYLASNFSEYKQDLLEKALDENDAPVSEYVENNKADFYTAEYLTYSIDKSSKDFDNDADFDAAVAEAKAAAEKIAEAKTPAEFVALVAEYEGDEAETETGTEAEDPAEKYKKEMAYSTSNDLGKWLFEEKAQVGDSKVIEETGTETEKETEEESAEETETAEAVTYNTYKATAYLVVSASALDKTPTKAASYLITDDKAAMDDFVASFKDGAELTRDAFVKLGEEKYEALHAGHDHEEEGFVEPVFSYSNDDNMVADYFTADYDVMNQWIESGDLKDNTLSDVMEIKVGEGENEATYYAVIFFEKYAEETWYAAAYTSVISEQFEEWYEAELEEKPLVYNEEALADMNTIMMYSGTADDGHDH